MAGRVGAILLVACGFFLMANAAAAQRALYQKQELSADLLRQASWQPLTELLLGVVFTFGVLFFANHVFVAQYTVPLGFGVAALCTVLTAWGAYVRYRHFWQETPLTKPPEGSLPLQRRYCCGLALFLAGALLAVFEFC